MKINPGQKVAIPLEPAKAESKPQRPAPAMANTLPPSLFLPAPSGQALQQLLPLELPTPAQLPLLLAGLLGARHQGWGQTLRLLAAVLRLPPQRLPPRLQAWLAALPDESKKLLDAASARLEQGQWQSQQQEALFFSLPLPKSDDWLELSWPKPRGRQAQTDAELVVTLLLPLPGLGRLLVLASAGRVRFYADSEALKVTLDQALPVLAGRLEKLGIRVPLESYRGQVPESLLPRQEGFYEKA
ncbi:hypothetical protein [Gallaecimonas sp. GXIMD4217]|uniref:hypothetical protein n=1 Tax=Gallaecimonas sp. GXIMD4217 TaxID=3131927 RepID=UPI00311B3BCF